METGQAQKVAFELSREDNTRLNEFVPWGMKSHLFRRMTEMLIASLEAMGPNRGKVLAAILDGDLVLVTRIQLEEWRDGAKRSDKVG